LILPVKGTIRGVGTTLRRGWGILPCGPEADVGYSDTAENEERRETG
jgi:hypothetical protein